MDQLQETFEYIEIAKIVNIDYTNGSCDLVFHDITGGERKTIPYPLPYAGKGWGILVGPEEGSMVAVGYDRQNRPWILSYRPIVAYFNSDVEGIPFIGVNDFPYRRPEAGEVVLQSKSNSAVELNKRGDVRLETVDGTYFELNKELETIIQQSVDTLTVSEAGVVKTGLVRRDIREESEREADALFGNTFGINTAEILFSNVIGKDPQYEQQEAEKGSAKGLYDPSDLREGIEVTTRNPALVESHFELEEYADSNVGIDEIQLTDAQKSIGKMQVNRLMDIKTGTIVNELGKILRFDYNFGKGNQGHGDIYKASKDFFFNKINTLRSSVVSEDYEKFISELAKINAGIMFQLLMHTKGADFQGSLESETFRGALWSLLVDKEGLTKLEIPAATNLGDEAGEPGRAGKSLLANLNGSMTLGLGKEKSEDTSVNNVLNSEVAHSTKGRKDRSLTIDAEGNVEMLIGADEEKKQSIMFATDGSIEAKIGKDTDNEQSIRVTTEGGIFVTVNAADASGDAINLNVTGNATVKVDGDTKIDTTGDSKIKSGGDVLIESTANTIDLKGTGLAEKIIKGQTFQKLFNTHVHLGNLGAPTAPVLVPLVGLELSQTSTTT